MYVCKLVLDQEIARDKWVPDPERCVEISKRSWFQSFLSQPGLGESDNATPQFLFGLDIGVFRSYLGVVSPNLWSMNRPQVFH